MEKRLFWWEVGTAVIAAVGGSLLHFFYDWSGQSALAGAFSAVNESVWEHMKLLFVPLFVEFFLHSHFLGRIYPNLPAARALGTVAGLVWIPMGFYTYTGIFGVHALWADILLFWSAAALAAAVEFHILRRSRFSALWQQVAGLLALWALAFLFVWCTFRPPHLNLWRDSVTGGFGL